MNPTEVGIILIMIYILVLVILKYKPKTEPQEMILSTLAANGVDPDPNCPFSIADQDDATVPPVTGTTDATAKATFTLIKGRRYKLTCTDDAGNEGSIEFTVGEDKEVSVALKMLTGN